MAAAAVADYLVVGAGPAGCAAAAALARGGASVAILERGGWPLSLPRRVEHGLEAARALAAASRRLPARGTPQHVLQARVVGGGGAINAMLWCPPTGHDVTEALGTQFAAHRPSFEALIASRVAAPPPTAVARAWRELLPAVAAQASADASRVRQDARGCVRATRISCVAGLRQSPAQLLLQDTAQREARDAAEGIEGIAPQLAASLHITSTYTPHPRAPPPDSPQTVGEVALRAAETAVAAAGEAGALPAAALRPNVSLATHIDAEQVTLDSNGRAHGIVTADGRELIARRGVVLAGGAIETPALLLRSGIGPEAVLAAAGVDCRLPLPGVGEELSDHVLVNDYAALRPDSRLREAPAAAEYDMPYQVHDAAGNAAQLSVSRLLDDPLAWKLFAEFRYPLYRLLRVRARRYLRVQLKLTNEAARGRVVLGAGRRPELDMTPTLAHARRHRDDLAAELAALAAQVDTLAEASGVRLDSVFRETLLRQPADYLWSGYHYAGTCAMGSVVTPDTMAVRGLEGLHVADTSAARVTSTGNSQALAYFCGHACGERLAARDAGLGLTS